MNNSSEQDILTDAGRASAQLAKDLAESEFEKYQTRQRQIEADTANEEPNRTVKLILQNEGKKRINGQRGFADRIHAQEMKVTLKTLATNRKDVLLS